MNLLRLVTLRKTVSSYDPDAQAFFTAAGITDATEKSAVNQLVLDLKSNNLWVKMDAIYPFVGGTSSSNSYNLKDTTKYQITWNGTVTFSSNGVTGNGSNGYGNTNAAPNQVGSQDSVHASIYSRTNVAENAFELGAEGSPTLALPCKYAGSFYMKVNDGTWVSVANANSQGLYTITRTGSTTATGYKNGTSVLTSTASSSAPSSLKIYICGNNYNGTANNFSTKNLAFVSLGSGLNATESSNLYTMIQAYQTTLGRQV